MRGKKIAAAAAMIVLAATLGMRVMADEASDFKDAFVKLLTASKTDFKDVLDGKPEVTKEDDKIYKSKVNLPGVKEEEIWVYKETDLSPSYRSHFIVDGSDKDEGDRVYKDVAAKVKASLPEEWKTEEYTIADRYIEGMELIAYPPDESRKVTLNIKTDRKSKEINVELIIDAKDRE